MSIAGRAHSSQTNGRLSGIEPPSERSATRGVILLNLGTPDAPHPREVRRYLAEFLSDPEVIRLPRRMRWMNPVLGGMIARIRAKQSAHAYSTIWTPDGSPLLVITNQQVAALQQSMPRGWRVYAAMRYGNPSVASVLDQIIADGIEELTVIPMYPQYSGPTTGTAMDDLYRRLHKRGQRLSLTVRNAWHDDAGYIDAQAELLRQFILERDLHPEDCVLLYSAHSMPESYIRDGDPYQRQIIESVEHVTERLGWPADRTAIAYQSKLGPVPWLSPSTEDSLRELGESGERNVLVCPISFTADCLESLEEIGEGYREMYEAFGGELHLCPALNKFGPFIKSLMQLVLRGPKPVAQCKGERPPLIEFSERREEASKDADPFAHVDRLVMIGASLQPRLGRGDGPDIRYVSPKQFRGIKRPQEEVAQLLNGLRSNGPFRECWLWNTCSRFEFYGWMEEEGSAPESDQSAARAVRMIQGDASDDVELNVLYGRDALHHLLRTSVGLNSGLPGDGEVCVQLQSAQRIAKHAQTLGALSTALIERIVKAQEALGEGTRWDRFRPEYCPVAMKRAALKLDLEWTGLNYVVIGGSVTASSVIDALREHFGVDAGRITAIHRSRSRGAQLTRLKKAVRKGTRLAVEQYDDQAVLDAMAQADVVFFTTDSRKPLIDDRAIRGLRDSSQRPLTIIDFNTFGSTEGMADVPGVTLIDAENLEKEIQHFGDGLLDCPAFAETLRRVERSIRCAVRAERPLDMSHCQQARGEQCPQASGRHHNGTSENGDARRNGQHATSNGRQICPCPKHAALSTCPERLMTERIGS